MKQKAVTYSIDHIAECVLHEEKSSGITHSFIHYYEVYIFNLIITKDAMSFTKVKMTVKLVRIHFGILEFLKQCLFVAHNCFFSFANLVL